MSINDTSRFTEARELPTHNGSSRSLSYSHVQEFLYSVVLDRSSVQ